MIEYKAYRDSDGIWVGFLCPFVLRKRLLFMSMVLSLMEFVKSGFLKRM